MQNQDNSKAEALERKVIPAKRASGKKIRVYNGEQIKRELKPGDVVFLYLDYNTERIEEGKLIIFPIFDESKLTESKSEKPRDSIADYGVFARYPLIMHGRIRGIEDNFLLFTPFNLMETMKRNDIMIPVLIKSGLAHPFNLEYYSLAPLN